MPVNNDKENRTSVPLKDRKDEILPLAVQYVKLAEDQLGIKAKKLSKESRDYIIDHDWPENETELEAAVRRACILSDGDKLELEDFDLKHRKAWSIGKFIESRLKGFMKNIKRFESFNLYDMVIPEVEKALIVMVLEETKGNQIRAAGLLGINRNTLRSKMRKLGIKAKVKL